MSGPRRHADHGSGEQEMVEDRGAGGRDDAFVGETEGGVQAAGFFDDGVQVGEGEGLFPGNEAGRAVFGFGIG